jgi:hypothetical protein
MIRVLPLFISCILQFWNAGAVSEALSLNTNQRLSFDVGQRESFSSANQFAALTITDGPDVRAWTVIDGVEFEAIEPSTKWTLPFDGDTGIMLANPSTATVTHFTLSGATIDAPFGGYVSVAFFVREAYGKPLTGNLTITADAPIGVWATECDSVSCVASPVQRF